MARKKIVAGNWKMNKTPSEAAAWAKELSGKLDTSKADVVFCVPFVDIAPVIEAVKGTGVAVGAENVHFEDSGEFTGEVSAKMLVDAGVKYVVIGHSERRAKFAETDEIVNLKTKKALAEGLIPIVCVGETRVQREQGITVELVRTQVKIALGGVSAEDAKKVVIAYEPVWAIGKNALKAATKEEAEEVCAAIRKVLEEVYGQNIAEEMRIQYGGSVNGENAAELFAMPNIDGCLVGGASLKPEFEKIVTA
jgi:triosephosphate isomerase